MQNFGKWRINTNKVQNRSVLNKRLYQQVSQRATRSSELFLFFSHSSANDYLNKSVVRNHSLWQRYFFLNSALTFSFKTENRCFERLSSANAANIASSDIEIFNSCILAIHRLRFQFCQLFQTAAQHYSIKFTTNNEKSSALTAR